MPPTVLIDHYSDSVWNHASVLSLFLLGLLTLGWTLFTLVKKVKRGEYCKVFILFVCCCIILISMVRWTYAFWRTNYYLDVIAQYLVLQVCMAYIVDVLLDSNKVFNLEDLVYQGNPIRQTVILRQKIMRAIIVSSYVAIVISTSVIFSFSLR